MIISSETIHKDGKDFKLEIVDGEDIIRTYRENSMVRSCMSKSKTLGFYAYHVPKLQLLRIIYKDKIALRSLLWTGVNFNDRSSEIKLLDDVYKAGYDTYGVRTTEELNLFEDTYRPIGDSAYKKIFLPNWEKYADVRNTARVLLIKALPYPAQRHTPYMGTVRYSSHDRTILSNQEFPGMCRDMRGWGVGGCRARLFKDLHTKIK